MKWIGLLISLLLAYGVAYLGGRMTMASLRTWYAKLKKPSWNPPNWLFGPVWSILYTSMAVAAWLVWRQGGFAQQALPLTLYLIQLFLNLLWSLLFFGMRRPDLAQWESLLLWLFILLTIIAFAPVSKVAALLLVPYLLWVTFATLLNFTIVRLNR